MERENNSVYAEKKLKFLKNWHRAQPFLRQTLNADSGQWLCNMHPLARCFSFRRVVKRHSNQKTSQMFRGFKSGGCASRCSPLNVVSFRPFLLDSLKFPFFTGGIFKKNFCKAWYSIKKVYEICIAKKQEYFNINKIEKKLERIYNVEF